MELTSNKKFIEQCLKTYKNKDKERLSYLNFLIEGNHDLLLRFFIEEELDSFDPMSTVTDEEINKYKMDTILYSMMMELINAAIPDETKKS